MKSYEKHIKSYEKHMKSLINLSSVFTWLLERGNPGRARWRLGRQALGTSWANLKQPNHTFLRAKKHIVLYHFYMIFYGFYMILYDFYMILYGFCMISCSFYFLTRAFRSPPSTPHVEWPACGQPKLPRNCTISEPTHRADKGAPRGSPADRLYGPRLLRYAPSPYIFRVPRIWQPSHAYISSY